MLLWIAVNSQQYKRNHRSHNSISSSLAVVTVATTIQVIDWAMIITR